jgi:Ca2+-binding RTX toxin-like protein
MSKRKRLAAALTVAAASATVAWVMSIGTAMAIGPADVRGTGGRDVITIGTGGDGYVVTSNTPIGMDAADGCRQLSGPTSWTCDAFRVVGFFVFGQGGNDSVTVNNSVQEMSRIFGGPGRDRLLGGSEIDALFGGPGNDELFGRGDRDSIRGAKGNDRIFGGQGPDAMLGGAGNDFIRGGPGNDTGTCSGGAGNNNVIC